MSDIIATRTLDDTIYIFNPNTIAWDVLPIQPGTPAISPGIWGGPNGTIWAHNGINSGGLGRYLKYDGIGAWTQHVGPDTTPTLPYTIHGSDDGQWVYAGCGNLSGTGIIQRLNAGTWETALSGVNRVGSVWCDATGQYVWATAGVGGGYVQTLYFSDDYGATWNNRFSEMLADIFPDYGNTPAMGGVWGVSANQVYFEVGWETGGGPGGNGGRIVLWDGTEFSVASSGDGNDFNTFGRHGMWADANNIIACGGFDVVHILRDNAGSLEITIDGGAFNVGWGAANGRGVMGTGNTIIAARRGIWTAVGDTQVSFNGGDSWQLISEPWALAQQTIDTLTEANWEVFVDSLSGGPVTERGGHLLVATGTFPQGEALAITLDGEPCYGGQGKAYDPVSEDGTTVSFWTPPVAKGADKQVEIVTSGGSILGSVNVVERSWGSAEHDGHRRHPPWTGTGAKRLRLEDLI